MPYAFILKCFCDWELLPLASDPAHPNCAGVFPDFKIMETFSLIKHQHLLLQARFLKKLDFPPLLCKTNVGCAN